MPRFALNDYQTIAAFVLANGANFDPESQE